MPSARHGRVDVVTFEVLRHRLWEINVNDEMGGPGWTVISPLIIEWRDGRDA